MKTVLITGGSSGIGFEMSKHWAREDYHLLWVSHDREELRHAQEILKKDFPNVRVNSLVQNLIEEAGAKSVYNWSREFGIINVVINNAGFGTYGYVNELDVDREIQMIQLNAVTPYKLTRLYLKDMIARNSGTIINICSNSAFQPVPRMSTYAATKAFVYQFSRGLQEELEIIKSNVRVMTICPAAISDTPFKNHLPKSVKTFQGLAATTAKEVAHDVWKGYKNKKSFVVSGKKMRRLYAIRGLLPMSLQRYLVRKETEEVS